MTGNIALIPSSGTQGLLGVEQSSPTIKNVFGGVLSNILGSEMTVPEGEMSYEDYTAAAQILINMLAVVQEMQQQGIGYAANAEIPELKEQLQLLQELVQKLSQQPELQESAQLKELQKLLTSMDEGKDIVVDTDALATHIARTLETIGTSVPATESTVDIPELQKPTIPLLRPAPESDYVSKEMPIEITMPEHRISSQHTPIFGFDTAGLGSAVEMNTLFNAEQTAPVQILPEEVMIQKVTVRETIGGVKEVTMDLIPENLGRVHVEISLENNAMRAVVKCDNPATMRLFNDNIHILENALKDHQISVNSFQFAFNDGKRQSSRQFEEQKRKKTTPFIFEEVRGLSADAAVAALRTVDMRL